MKDNWVEEGIDIFKDELPIEARGLQAFDQMDLSLKVRLHRLYVSGRATIDPKDPQKMDLYSDLKGLDDVAYSQCLKDFDKWALDRTSQGGGDYKVACSFRSMASECKSVNIGSHGFILKPCKGEDDTKAWFLAHPGYLNRKERETMRFGCIQSIFCHIGTDGKENVFLDVEWHLTEPHESGKVFAEEIRAPLVSKKVKKRGLFPDSWVVPWPCWGSPLMSDPRAKKLVMVAEHWHILRLLGHGIPSLPEVLTFPDFLKEPSIPAAE